MRKSISSSIIVTILLGGVTIPLLASLRRASYPAVSLALVFFLLIFFFSNQVVFQSVHASPFPQGNNGLGEVNEFFGSSSSVAQTQQPTNAVANGSNPPPTQTGPSDLTNQVASGPPKDNIMAAPGQNVPAQVAVVQQLAAAKVSNANGVDPNAPKNPSTQQNQAYQQQQNGYGATPTTTTTTTPTATPTPQPSPPPAPTHSGMAASTMNQPGSTFGQNSPPQFNSNPNNFMQALREIRQVEDALDNVLNQLDQLEDSIRRQDQNSQFNSFNSAPFGQQNNNNGFNAQFNHPGFNPMPQQQWNGNPAQQNSNNNGGGNALSHGLQM